MTGRVLTTVATLAWLVAGVAAAHGLTDPTPAITAVPPPAATAPSPTDVVVISGLAELAARAWARGDDPGTAALRALPRLGTSQPLARDGDHYVEAATVQDLDGSGYDWTALVRVQALRATPDGYERVGHVLVSVPITRHLTGWALAGQPVERADTASAGTAG